MASINRASASRSYRYLARQIENDMGDLDKAREIVVTSPESFDLSNNSILMFANGLKNELGSKVILVDATFRGKGLGAFLGFGNKPGLANLLYEKEVKMGQMIVPTRVDDIHVLPAGNLGNKNFEPLKSDKVKNILQKLGTAYDYIIIQLGPLQEDTRYISVAELVDLALVLVQEGVTLLEEIEMYRSTFENHQISNYQFVMSQK